MAATHYSPSSLLLAAGLVAAFGATLCSAAPCAEQIRLRETGLTVPANITRGVPFEITYQYDVSEGGPTYLYAMYGIDKASKASYPALGFPDFVRQDGSTDTGTVLPSIDSDADQLTVAFNLAIPKREDDSLGKYADGEAIFGLALFGVQGINLVPVVTQVNHTTFVSQQ